jgi:3-methyladenine DNA glycosylase AlkD
VTAIQVKRALAKFRDDRKAKAYARFFQTGPGQYGESDRFWGLTVPQQRRVARRYRGLPLKETEVLLASGVHEHRLTALVILTEQFRKASEARQKKIVTLYLKNISRINNWDLVDLSAPKILGAWLADKDKKVLFKLAGSKSLWERRIAVLATFAFIRQDEFKTALEIAERLLDDDHDLIHKAVGWQLREIGKQNQEVEEAFLKKHYRQMPRTMLRYAIERFEESRRQSYLKPTSWSVTQERF